MLLLREIEILNKKLKIHCFILTKDLLLDPTLYRNMVLLEQTQVMYIIVLFLNVYFIDFRHKKLHKLVN